jgi:hypothetical protein
LIKEANLNLAKIQGELNRISAEMITIINKYGMNASNPLEVISIAREKITNKADYIRFLELSLEGRIYGDYGEAFKKTEN